MRRLVFLLAALLLLTVAGCAASAPEETLPEVTVLETLPPESVPETLPPETVPPTTLPPDPLKRLLNSMTLEERVGQLFLARHPRSGGLEDISRYHLGGYLLFAEDLQGHTPESLRQLLSSYQSSASVDLLIAVDEEGGSVTRVSCFPAFRHRRFYSPRYCWSQGGMEAVLASEEEKAQLLTGLGINVNMGPVADIATSPGAFMYNRSLGQNAEVTADFVAQTVDIYADHRLGSVLKHFPGYGSNADTHTGSATDLRGLETLEATDLVPFRAGIDAGCGAVMISHNVVAALDESRPASLSPEVYRYLRQELGFGGVALTDDLAMDAVAKLYSPGEAAVQAVLAGCDLLCCSDYATQYEAVLTAVLEGRISIDRLNEAATRVLQWKQQLGLIQE